MHKGFSHFIRGVTLIELMVGMAIGLVTLLAVFQIYATWEGRQRTGASKNDAQISGSMAAFALERDLRLSSFGYGPASNPSDTKAGCTVNATFNGAAFSFPLLPIQIVNGALGGPDQINTLYGESALRVIREAVLDSTASSKSLLNRGGIVPGDKVILTDSNVANTCRLVEVTNTSPPVNVHAFEHNVGAYQSAYTAEGKLALAGGGAIATATLNLAAGTGASAFDEAFDMGVNPQANNWRIAGASPVKPILQRTNRLPTNGVASLAAEVAEDIVNLQAQYGYDVDNNGQISAAEWFDANPAVAPALGLPVPTDWSRLLAVRFGILARSRQYEILPFRAANPSWAAGQFVMRDISGGADSNPAGANNWRAYRYAVYESVIPVRNVLWGRGL
jgi:type IV pilus assembly protein PilW